MASDELMLLLERLDEAPAAERKALKKRLLGLRRRQRKDLPIDRGLAAVRAAFDGKAQRRESAVDPSKLEFDPALPICRHIEAIQAALRSHQVLIVAGETGSGKTTQLPKICLSIGRGVDGQIGVTQPRRIAARSIARRLSDELHSSLGQTVGYQVRFDERLSEQTQIRLMTDGILLAQTQSDRELSRYDTLIIDEAHERSLNVDFLLGYLRRLLPSRPDLKVLITSATIDVERFSSHFNNCPIIEVSGRGYPVDYRYRPLEEESTGLSRDLPSAVLDATTELELLDPMGDVLVFLPGERDIREVGDRLAQAKLRHTEVLPLYARLNARAQAAIFHPGKLRRVILATNVAETSLTVPRVKFVIDSGLARISRYSHRSKVQRLPIEAISQASANQRAGRCGRLGPGVCVRLFSEQDFTERELFTAPEIVRTNLATVILQMSVLRLGSIEQFPFVDAPETSLINDGYQLLFELGALDAQRNLTAMGRRMARWPVDVRLARLLEAASDHQCSKEASILSAVLAIADPRERPSEAQQEADVAHQQWRDEQSDFVGLLNLWKDYVQARKAYSQRKLREWCQRNFLNFLRMREWSDLQEQLERQMLENKLALNDKPADFEAIHQALVIAFVGQVGIQDGTEYVGARNRRFSLFPGSDLFKKGGKWIVSAFLVETTRVYARVNARIDPKWIEAASEHLVKSSIFDPYWSKRTGKVLGYERLTLFGLPIVSKRRIHFGARDPIAAANIFLQEGLARGQLKTRGGFLQHNGRLIEQILDLEVRQRQHNLLVDEDDIAAWYGQRVPSAIFSAKQFERWREQAEAEQPRLLFMDRKDLLRDDIGRTESLFPKQMTIGGIRLALRYRFEPGHPNDGVTIRVPLHLLNLVTEARLQWLVPGLQREKVIALIKSLPKPMRRHFVPVPDCADRFLADANMENALFTELVSFLTTEARAQISESDFLLEQLATHLIFNIHVLDGKALVAGSRNLAALQEEYGIQAREQFFTRAGAEFHRDGLVRWDFGAVPITVDLGEGAIAYPALVEVDDASAGIRLFDQVDEAKAHHRLGVARLVRLQLKEKFRLVNRQLRFDHGTQLRFAMLGDLEVLREEITQSALLEQIDSSAQVRDSDAYQRLLTLIREQIGPVAEEFRKLVSEVVDQSHELRLRLDQNDMEALYPWAYEDIESQLDWLLFPGFVSEAGLKRMREYPRYLNGIAHRINALELNPQADRQRFAQVDGFWQDTILALTATDDPRTDLMAFRWQVEEYRISVFAQHLKTPNPISTKRLAKIWQNLA